MGKKSLKPHVEYVDECLELLKKKLGEAKQYLDDVRWEDMVEVEDREKEFKFQAKLVDSYVGWLNEYSSISGMVEKLKEYEGTQNQKETRKGSFRSTYAELIKEGLLD